MLQRMWIAMSFRSRDVAVSSVLVVTAVVHTTLPLYPLSFLLQQQQQSQAAKATFAVDVCVCVSMIYIAIKNLALF